MNEIEVRPICGAKKRNGDPCRSFSLYPNGRCRLHGGPSRSGPSHPRWKGGVSFTRYPLPKRFREAFEDACNDVNLLSQRQDMALAEAIITDLIGKLDTGESGAAWKRLKLAMDSYDQAREPVEQFRALAIMRELIERGAGDAAARREIGEWQERKGRAQERERRRLVEMTQTLTYKEVAGLVVRIVAVIKSVCNAEQCVAIATALAKMVGMPGMPMDMLEANPPNLDRVQLP